MARTDTLDNFLIDVAAAIKAKKGDDSPIPAPNFDTETLNLDDGSQIINSIIDGTIEELTLPEGTTKIGSYAFYGCNNLIMTSLPANVTSIGHSAFYCCKKLALESLPSSLTRIEGRAFYECYIAFTEIPEGVMEIDNQAFTGAGNKTCTLTFKGTPTRIASTAFQDSNFTELRVPWAEGEVKYAPWGIAGGDIIYNYTDT